MLLPRREAIAPLGTAFSQEFVQCLISTPESGWRITARDQASRNGNITPYASAERPMLTDAKAPAVAPIS